MCNFQVSYWSAADKDGQMDMTTPSRGPPLQQSPFVPNGSFDDDSTLHLRYIVEPRAEWDELKPLTKVLIRDVLYRRRDYVYIRGQDGRNSHALWIARIQEIRACDNTRAYARVLWMYRPEDLSGELVCGGARLSNDGGRQAYHGHAELIASNHMDIISLSCIIGKSTVRQWVEEKNQKHRTWYWRQAVNVLSQQLSAPRHCPAAGTGCGIWLHQACVAAFQTNVKPAQWGTPEEVADGGTNAGLSKRILCPACYAEI
ncbi:hypothetical protein EV126DRAFT_519197 [Verticillium dahliae]|nr:hypothetical protein EV126DRAFT_519197 [Verticillium dahliae]